MKGLPVIVREGESAMEPRPWHQHYDADVPLSLDYPAIPVHQLLNDAVAKYPDSTAFIFFDNKRTYRQLNAFTPSRPRNLPRLFYFCPLPL